MENHQAPIRILHVLGVLNMGGAESRIMDLYRHIDRSKVQFDFLVHTIPAADCGNDLSSESLMAHRTPDYYDEEVLSLGGHIYALPRFRGTNLTTYRKAAQAFFATHHEWTAVEGHMTSMASIYLPIAKSAGVPVTIAHVRSAGVDHGLRGVVTNWFRQSLPKKADILMTCSKLAGEAVYGKKVMEQPGRVMLVPNALSISKFAYNEEARKLVRARYGIADDTVVLGHVGRFDEMKNHAFLVPLLTALNSGSKAKYQALFVGSGKLMEEVTKALAESGQSDAAIFAGQCAADETAQMYQAMDCFVFPSLYEGLPGTVIEAQAAGLPVVMADTITSEVALTDLVSILPLSDDDGWVDKVKEVTAEEGRADNVEVTKGSVMEAGSSAEEGPAGNEDRAKRSADAIKALTEAGYEIQAQSAKMQEWYLSLKP